MRAVLRILVLPLALALLASPALVGATPASAASSVVAISQSGNHGLTLKIVSITAGRLIILGTTSRPGVEVTVHGTPWRAISDAQGTFRFDVIYRTPTCTLALVTPTGWIGVLIGECGTQGVVPRGAWVATAQYDRNDLVLDGGSAWIGLRISAGQKPAAGSPYWELFAASGATGLAGPAGATGAQGPQASAGATGLKGPAGPAGAIGPAGPAGPVGTIGPVGATGPAGPAGPAGSVGPVGAQGEPGLDGADGAMGPVGPAGPTGPAGAVGPQGGPGLDGADGAMGPVGPAGPQGDPGVDGAMGPAGLAGP